LPDARTLVELPHLTVGAPLAVAVPGVSEVEIRELIKTPRRVELRRPQASPSC
jgi:hypothetical protein